MGLLSYRVKRSDLEAGDHVFVDDTYFRHGIYVGGDMVVHLSVDNFSSCRDSSASCSSPEHGCVFRTDGSAVTMTCLDCFMKKGSLCRYEYGVNKAAFILVKHQRTCTAAKSDAAEKVIHRAMYLLENGFGDYHLLKNNCEDFALYCKTGLLISYHRRPASDLGLQGGCGHDKDSVTTSAVFPLVAAAMAGMLVGVPVSTTIASCSKTSASSWYARDITQRHDVYEVEVERVEEFRRSYVLRIIKFTK